MRAARGGASAKQSGGLGKCFGKEHQAVVCEGAGIDPESCKHQRWTSCPFRIVVFEVKKLAGLGSTLNESAAMMAEARTRASADVQKLETVS